MTAAWDEELDELARRRALAAQMGGRERVERQHASGRLTVRERIDALVDPGSWREVGALTGVAEYDADGELAHFLPANTVTGACRLGGQRAVIAADDFTVRGGAADATIHEKQVAAERMAHDERIPLVRLIDGTGGGGSVKTLADTGRTYVPHNPGWDLVVANLARVPVVAAALGPVAGLGAARLVTSHFSVMVRERSQVFVAGPPVVEAGMGERVDKEELGGWRLCQRAGTVDAVVDTEQEAFAAMRAFISYLPPNVWRLAVRGASSDDPSRRDPALRGAIPRNRRRSYDVRAVITSVFDVGSVLELGAGSDHAVVTALARLDGWPVAVLASDPQVYGGGLSASGSAAMERFVDLADTFRLPVVHLVDQPGFLIGTTAERAGTIRAGSRALAAVYQATVPWASVLLRRVFGVAGAAHRNHARHGLRVAWPSGDWGSLPVEGGLEVAYKRALAEADDPEALKAQLLEELEAVRSPFRTAERFLVEDVIDPAETRPLLCDWVTGAYETLSCVPPEQCRSRLRP